MFALLASIETIILPIQLVIIVSHFRDNPGCFHEAENPTALTPQARKYAERQ
jgi:hypothetical protein